MSNVCVQGNETIRADLPVGVTAPLHTQRPNKDGGAPGTRQLLQIDDLQLPGSGTSALVLLPQRNALVLVPLCAPSRPSQQATNSEQQAPIVHT